MRIHGLTENFSRYNNLQVQRKNIFVNENNNVISDSFSISDVAKRLNINFHKSQKLTKTENINEVPEIAKSADNAMKKAIDILERIKNLTELAEDKELGDDSRIEIQIEIEDLRDNLAVIPRNLYTDENKATYSQLFESQETGTSILDRIRTRINNGEKWNVREAWQVQSGIEHSDGTKEIISGGWAVVDDSNIITQSEGKFIAKSKKIPTVLERLEAGTPYVVMNSKSAEKSTALIESQIKRINEYREKLPELVNQGLNENDIKTEAGLFLEQNIIFPNSKYQTILNSPDFADYFKIANEIYDKNYFGFVVLNESGERIITPSDVNLM